MAHSDWRVWIGSYDDIDFSIEHSPCKMEDVLVVVLLITQLILIMVVVTIVFLLCIVIKKNNHLEVS